MSRWSIPLDKLAAKAKADLDTVARKATLELFSRVTIASPVDTGRFRANWNVSYGTIDISTSASTDQTRAAREVAKVATLPVGGTVYLANALPYARLLEYGSSKQAPNGMVRIAAQQFSDFVHKAVQQ